MWRYGVESTRWWRETKLTPMTRRWLPKSRTDAGYPRLRPEADTEQYRALNQKGRYCQPGSGGSKIFGGRQ